LRPGESRTPFRLPPERFRPVARQGAPAARVTSEQFRVCYRCRGVHETCVSWSVPNDPPPCAHRSRRRVGCKGAGRRAEADTPELGVRAAATVRTVRGTLRANERAIAPPKRPRGKWRSTRFFSQKDRQGADDKPRMAGFRRGTQSMGGLAAAQLRGNTHERGPQSRRCPAFRNAHLGTVLYWFESSRLARY
jgi:hypothetical protein